MGGSKPAVNGLLQSLDFKDRRRIGWSKPAPASSRWRLYGGLRAAQAQYVRRITFRPARLVWGEPDHLSLGWIASRSPRRLRARLPWSIRTGSSPIATAGSGTAADTRFGTGHGPGSRDSAARQALWI